MKRNRDPGDHSIDGAKRHIILDTAGDADSNQAKEDGQWLRSSTAKLNEAYVLESFYRRQR